MNYAGPQLPDTPLLPARSELRFLVCGSVDDGKSTLIGRLIHDSVGLLEDQMAALRADSRRFGSTGDQVDFSLLLDGLEAEREQGITMDVAYRYFATERRAFVVADTPGHRQYTRNMATGASKADLAVLLVDGRKGLLEQTRRHATIAALLGIRHVVLALNKIDTIDYDEARACEIEAAFEPIAKRLNFRTAATIPLSARHGDNVVSRSVRTPWYVGPTLLDHLESIDVDPDESDRPFRFPVQWVNRTDGTFRGYAGTVASGSIAVGDRVVVAGSGQSSEIARIVTFNGDLPAAVAGRSVTLTLTDDLHVARGDVLAAPQDRPTVTRRFSAKVVWMSAEPLEADARLLLKAGTATTPATARCVTDRLNLDTLEPTPANALALNDIGTVWFEADRALAFDPYQENPQLGSFILIDRATSATVGAGMVIASLDRASNVHHQPIDITPEIRAAQKSQRPLVVWLTGMPASGKSTIANLLERRLVSLGRHTVLLDGDNLRQGLNSDLGFDREARTENVRRTGELAKLMFDAGLITIVALVSPFRADRARVATLFEEDRFLEVFVDAPVEVCRQRDLKGLYRHSDLGMVKDVTGRDQPYEPPRSPALTLRTAEIEAEAAVERLLAMVLERI